LLVHSSLSSLGWVCGGATAVVQALLDAVGEQGTIVVPAQTADNRDPSTWADPAPPARWWPTIRQHLPAFEPALTPSHAMGAIAERVRTWPGSSRSTHPQTSFAAVGTRARELMSTHRLESQLGEESPLAALEDADARILLLGVGFDRCTAFHLGEYRLPDPPLRTLGCAMMTPTGRRWVTFAGVDLDDTDFAALGRAFEAQTDDVVAGRVGAAHCRIAPLRAAVEFASKWFIASRRTPGDSGQL
jgi:aminoglycoside 3-N-acetyltransferase